MSFVRKRVSSANTTNRIASNSTNSIAKKKSLSKPVWDSTNSDLSQLKPSQAELERRKASCQSKNAEAVRYEKQRREMLKAKKEQAARANDPSQLALLKEILYDDEQLKRLILKSDMTLKTVQDFFNEDDDQNSQCHFHDLNNKKQVKINMTLAPNVTDLNESNLPYNGSKWSKQQQKNSVSSAKIVNANNLSDNEESNSDVESEILHMKLKQAKQAQDFVQYRQLLELKQELINKKLNSPSLTKIRDQQQAKKKSETNDLDECIKMLSNKNYITPGRDSYDLKSSSNNDTEKINRLKDLIKNYASSMNLGSDETENKELVDTPVLKADKKPTLSNLNDEFKRALNELENKMYEFEKEIGEKKVSDCTMFKSLLDGTSSTLSNSSYTLSLIKIISTLLDYQKDTIKDLNHEKLKNLEANKQLDIHRKLIDGLTNEILCVKEQNEKIGTVYINQANQQAKIEAELDQIKIMLRSLNLNTNLSKPTSIDSQPKTSSAFYPAQQTDLNNIIKPMPYPSSNNQQMRPMSCITSINDYNRQNNVRYPLDDALNEIKGDKFAERLNAMLHSHNHTDSQNFNSVSCSNLNGTNRMSMIGQNTQQSDIINMRSSSAYSNQFRTISEFNNSNDFNSNSDNLQVSQNIPNSHRYSDFNAQIQELGAKNAKAQQKLKQLQSEQVNNLNSNPKQESNVNPKVQENLNKLKEEQQLLKDQINMLNKQRESAQNELEVLSINSSHLTKSSKSSNDKNKFMQSLQNIEFNRIDINQDITPNMSPIPNENIFHEGIEAKSSAHRFTLPPNSADAIASMNNKNRE